MKPKAPALPIDLAAAPEPVSENLQNQMVDILTAKYLAARRAAWEAGQGLYEWEVGLAIELLQGFIEDKLSWEQKDLGKEAERERAAQIEEMFREDLARRQKNVQPDGRDFVDAAGKLLCENLTAMENHCRHRANEARNRGTSSLTEREVKQYQAALGIFGILTAMEGRTPEYAKGFVEEDAGIPLNWNAMRKWQREFKKGICERRNKGLQVTEAAVPFERYEEIILQTYKDSPTEETLHKLLNIFKS